MLGPASAIRGFSLERSIGLSPTRTPVIRHFIGVAATLAAAKVLLATIGVALFVAEQGAAGLPHFYVGFAAIAILLSFGLSAIIDRAPKVRLAQITFAGLLLGAAALRLLLALEMPGVAFALLATATAFEIVLDILFWVVIAGYLDTLELRRATPLVYMALALGGAFGGALARVGAGVLLPADLLLLLLPLTALVVLQLEVVARQFHEVPDTHPDAADGAAEGLGLVKLCRLLKRYPLALLIALNALVVTLLYGLSEFLILSIYEVRFRSETELTEFLSLLFALMQIVEFGLLYTLTRLLLERTGPLLRNLVFPLASLGGLLLFLLRPKLAAAVVMHVNIEAVSNALFLPIHNANYLPLPLGLQGRARTLSEGICYPIGLALAGAIVWTADPRTALPQVEFAALIFAALCALLSAGIGLLFLPSLRINFGVGLLGRARIPSTMAAPVPPVRALLRSRDPELGLLGLALAQHLDPRELEDDLLTYATRPDRATRNALARLIAAAPKRWAQQDLDRWLEGESEAAMKLALLVMLIRRAPLASEQMSRIMASCDPVVRALGYLVAVGLEARARIEPLARSPKVASELVDAILCAGRSDCMPLLLDSLETAAPEQQRGALAMLSAGAEPPGPATAELARRLSEHRHPAVRAEAITLLGRARPRAAAVRALVAALDDPDGRVRRRAAEALCQHGDRATALLRRPLTMVTAASVDAVWALARIGSRSARRLLVAYVRQLRDEVERTLRLLDWVSVAPDRARWSALELGLRDHQARIVDVVLAALSPAIDIRLAGRVREALRGADQRRRASAFDLIAAVPASRLAPGAAALLHVLLFGHRASARRVSGPEPDLQKTVCDQAMASMSPWVRYAAARRAARPAPGHPVPSPASMAGPASSKHSGVREMDLDDQQLERIVALKRTPLFRYVPLETLAEVARTVQAQTYLAREEVITGGTSRQDLLILEAGALSIGHHDAAEILRAPACFGEIALAGERMPWPGITVVEEARVSFLRATIFEELCREHPEMALELCRLLARHLLRAGTT